MNKLLIFLLSMCVASLEAATITNWGAQLPTAVPAGGDVILMQKGGVTYYFTPNQLATQLSTNANLIIAGSGATPAPPLYSVQLNSNGVIQGSANLVFTNRSLIVNGELTVVQTNGPITASFWIPQSVFSNSLVVGNGGRLLTTNAPNPIDPNPEESNGSYNGKYNTFVGINAGLSTTAGNQNVFVGSDAGRFNTIGDQNVFIGMQAGQANLSGYHNVFIGDATGSEGTNMAYCTFVGTDAGIQASGSYNTLIGTASGGRVTGNYNSFVGQASGSENTTGFNNNYLGRTAGNKNLTGNYNLGLGTEALFNNLGSLNIGVGEGALYSHTTGNNNTAFGNYSYYFNVTGSNNVGLGYAAGQYETGSSTFYVGNMDYSNTQAERLGSLFYGKFNPTPSLQTLTVNASLGIFTTNATNALDVSGYTSLRSNLFLPNLPTNGSPVALLATDAGGAVYETAALVYRPPEIFSNSVVVGNGGTLLTRDPPNPIDPNPEESNGSYNGQYNTFLGINAGLFTTSGNQNVFAGASAGRFNTIGDQNTFIGNQAGQANISGFHNTFVGGAAGSEGTNMWYTTIIGCDAGIQASGSYLTIAGNGAGGRVTGNYNSFFGQNSGAENTAGFNNNYFGRSAGNKNLTGNYNLGFGTEALFNNVGSYNVGIGEGALYSHTTGDRNSAFGAYSFYANVTGTNNVGLGFSAGQYETGSDTLYIGNRDYLNTTAEKAGVLVYGTFSATPSSQVFSINGRLSVNNATPLAMLSVSNATATSPSFSVHASNNPTPTFINISNGNSGFGVSIPVNKLDIEGAVAIGASYSGSSTAPANGAIIEGNVGIGTASPSASRVTVKGVAAVPTSITNVMSRANIWASYSSIDTYGLAIAVSANAPTLQAVDVGGVTAASLVLQPFGGKTGIGTNAPAAYLATIADNAALNVVQFGTTNRPSLMTMDTNGTITATNINATGAVNANSYYATGDVSALTFTDRSTSPDTLDDAYAIVGSIKPLSGRVDHSKLHPKAWGSTAGVADSSKRDLSMVVSAQSLVIADLWSRIDSLERMRTNKFK